VASESPHGEGIRPRPDQVVGLARLAAQLAAHDRVQAIVPCGDGKTLLARWHAEAAGARRVLVLVPTLALMAQILAEWRRPAGWDFEALVVCSDPSTSAGAAGRQVRLELAPEWARRQVEVTTDPARVAAFLRAGTPPGQQPPAAPPWPQVVFSTYQSAPVVAAAQAHTAVAFDLAVSDEAHHLAGRPRREYRTVLDPQEIVARKRLFMTATPHVLAGGSDGEDLSMDDPRLFGPVAHRVPFAEARKAGRLVDYQVLVIAGREGHGPGNRGAAGAHAALLAAIDRRHLRRVLTFHSRIARARGFASALNGTTTPGGTTIRARHVSSETPAGQRAEALSWLAGGAGETRIIASARCLGEGIDVPAADGIVFADPRSSVRDIIQATGRVLRTAPGKTIGTIIIPVTLPADGDDDSAMYASRFAVVWAVLRALRAHDEELAADLDAAARAHGGPGWRGHSPTRRRVRFLLPGDIDERDLQIRLIEQTGSGWHRFYGALQEYARNTGGLPAPRTARWNGARIGEWAEQQRRARRSGFLPADRARLLEQVPGWAWDRDEGEWDHNHALLVRLVGRLGSLCQDPAAPSVYQDRHDYRGGPLGTWAARQRQAHRAGSLDAGRAARLASLPGWDWAGGLPDDDVQMITRLAAFTERESHADVPESHAEAGQELGRWVHAVRRRRLTGRLHPALAEEIAAAAPAGQAGSRGFAWQVAETRYRIAYSALRAYARREGSATPPARHVEQLPDMAVSLGQWAALQRHRHRRGALEPRHVAWLEAVSGWTWDPPGRARPSGEPLDLDGHAHGTARGVAAGCPCQPCLDHRRASGREQRARKRQIPGGFPAGQARRKLAALRAAGHTLTAISHTSGVPFAVLKALASGHATQVTPAHHAALLATTAAMCATAPTRVTGQGRTADAGSELIDPGPTRELLRSLASRGFGRSWVARELGYASGAPELGRLISRRVAEAVAGLAAAVGDLTAPGGRQQPVPPLRELKAAAARVPARRGAA
jgi:superfamily II DNA or RNA helicase